MQDFIIWTIGGWRNKFAKVQVVKWNLRLMYEKEVGYCNYHDFKFIERYNKLSYQNYFCLIEGNTFYLISEEEKWTGKFIKQRQKIYEKKIILPMIFTQEETIRDILRSYGFGDKYNWLYDDLQ